MKFIEGCIRLVGPFHVHRIPGSADKRLLKAMLAFCIFRTSTEAPCGGERCDGGDKLDQSCCFLSHKFDPACAMTRNWGPVRWRCMKVEAMMFECAMVWDRCSSSNHLLQGEKKSIHEEKTFFSSGKVFITWSLSTLLKYSMNVHAWCVVNFMNGIKRRQFMAFNITINYFLGPMLSEMNEKDSRKNWVHVLHNSLSLIPRKKKIE